MSELAQRIVSSHKAAAKRASAYLAQTRNVNLTNTQALELVAKVLGVENWQTLLSLANQGRGPRVDENTEAPKQTLENITRQLGDYYGKPDGRWGEHPRFSRKDWAYEVENGDTGASYWEYVLSRMDEQQEMLPWERDASFSVRLARIANMFVEYDDDGDEYGWIVADPWGFVFMGTCDSEIEAWDEVADQVKKHLLKANSLADKYYHSLAEPDWLGIALATYPKPHTR